MKVKRIRGDAWGAWNNDAMLARCAYRVRNYPGNRGDDVGFRCCFSPLFVKKERLENSNGFVGALGSSVPGTPVALVTAGTFPAAGTATSVFVVVFSHSL
jgi:hypothetical protein